MRTGFASTGRFLRYTVHLHCFLCLVFVLVRLFQCFVFDSKWFNSLMVTCLLFIFDFSLSLSLSLSLMKLALYFLFVKKALDKCATLVHLDVILKLNE